MKRLNLADLMLRLSAIPGLSFLAGWLTEVDAKRRRYKQATGDYIGYVNTAKKGASDVAGAVTGTDEDDMDDDESTGGYYDDEYGEDDWQY